MDEVEKARANLRRAVRGRDDALARVARAVVEAHEAGLSWSDIGSVLGITKQSAWETYGPDVREAEVTGR